MSSRAISRLQILGAALLFSTGGAAIKSAAFTSWQVAGLRSGVAAIAVWLLVADARRWGTTPREWMRTGLVAVAYAGTLTLFVLANKSTTAANTIFLQSTAPVYIILLAPWLLGERIHRGDVPFILTVGLGMGILFLGRQPSYSTAPDPARGNVLAAMSGVCYALLLLGFRWMGKEGGSPSAAVALGNLLAFLAAIPLGYPLGPHPLGDWAVILYLGLFQIALAYTLLSRAVTQVPALEVSLLLFLETALNPLWAWLVHGEAPGPWSLVGGAIILSATLLRAWKGGAPEAVVT